MGKMPMPTHLKTPRRGGQLSFKCRRTRENLPEIETSSPQFPYGKIRWNPQPDAEVKSRRKEYDEARRAASLPDREAHRNALMKAPKLEFFGCFSQDVE